MNSKHQNSSHLNKFKINCEKEVILVKRYLYEVHAFPGHCCIRK